MGSGNGAGHRGLALLGAVLDALAGEVGSAALRGLEDEGSVGVLGSLEGSDDGGGRGHVDGGNGETVGFGVLEQLQDVVAIEDAGLDVELLE